MREAQVAGGNVIDPAWRQVGVIGKVARFVAMLWRESDSPLRTPSEELLTPACARQSFVFEKVPWLQEGFIRIQAEKNLRFEAGWGFPPVSLSLSLSLSLSASLSCSLARSPASLLAWRFGSEEGPDPLELSRHACVRVRCRRETNWWSLRARRFGSGLHTVPAVQRGCRTLPSVSVSLTWIAMWWKTTLYRTLSSARIAS